MTPAALPIVLHPDPRAHKWARRGGTTRSIDANLIYEIKAAQSGSLLIMRRGLNEPRYLTNGRNNCVALLVRETPAEIGAMLAASGDFIQ